MKVNSCIRYLLDIGFKQIVARTDYSCFGNTEAILQQGKLFVQVVSDRGAIIVNVGVDRTEMIDLNLLHTIMLNLNCMNEATIPQLLNFIKSDSIAVLNALSTDNFHFTKQKIDSVIQARMRLMFPGAVAE